MKSLIGISLLTLGALPMVLIGAAWAAWRDHMYTIALSLNAERALVGLLVAEIFCLAIGLYLIAKSPSPRANWDTPGFKLGHWRPNADSTRTLIRTERETGTFDRLLSSPPNDALDCSTARAGRKRVPTKFQG